MSDNDIIDSVDLDDHDELDDEDHMNDDAKDQSEAGLPMVPESPGQRPSAMLRYEDIPPELAEGLRGIVNRWELRSRASLPKSVAVTAALRGEGVTTASQALSTIIAQETGSFVCWVDCSWLGEKDADDGDQPSLIDLMADQSKIVSAFQAIPELPQLMCLSPGSVPPSQRHMIVRSPEFGRLLTILTDEFDHVVFDVPAILSNANALALLQRADASLLVVKHRSTSINQVRSAVEATQPTPNLGVLLNGFDSRVPSRLQRLLET